MLAHLAQIWNTKILQSWQLMAVLVISTFSQIGQQALFYQETMPTAPLTLQ